METEKKKKKYLKGMENALHTSQGGQLWSLGRGGAREASSGQAIRGAWLMGWPMIQGVGTAWEIKSGYEGGGKERLPCWIKITVE